MGCGPSRLRPLELANSLRFRGAVEKGGSSGGCPVLSSRPGQREQVKLAPLPPGKLVLPKPPLHILKSIPLDRDFSDNTPHTSGRKVAPDRRTAKLASTSSAKPMDAASSVLTPSSPPRPHKKEAAIQRRQMKRTTSAPVGVGGEGGGSSHRQRPSHQSPERPYPDGQKSHRRQDAGDPSSQLPLSADPREQQKKESVGFASTHRNSLRREAHMNNIRRAWQSEQDQQRGETKHACPTPLHHLSPSAKAATLGLPSTEALISAKATEPSVYSEKVNFQELKTKTAESELEKSNQKGVVFTQVQMPTCTLNFTTVQDSSIDLSKAQDVFKITDRNNHRGGRNCPEQPDPAPVVIYPPYRQYPPPCYPLNAPTRSPPAYYDRPEQPRLDSTKRYPHRMERTWRPRDDIRNPERRNFDRNMERRHSDRRKSMRVSWMDRRSDGTMRNERLRNERSDSRRDERMRNERSRNNWSDERRTHRDLDPRPRKHPRGEPSSGHHKRRTRSPSARESDSRGSSSSYNREAPVSRRKSFHRNHADHSRRKWKDGQVEHASKTSRESRPNHDRHKVKVCNRCHGVRSPSPDRPCRCQERESRNASRPSWPRREPIPERLPESRTRTSRRPRSHESRRFQDEDEVSYHPYDRAYSRRRPVAARDRSWNREDVEASSDGEELYGADDLQGCLVLRPKGRDRSSSCSESCRERIPWRQSVMRTPSCTSRHRMHFCGEKRRAWPCRSPRPYSSSWRYATDDNCSSTGAECCPRHCEPSPHCRLCRHERRSSQECEEDCCYDPYDCSERTTCENLDQLHLSGPVTMQVSPDHFKRSLSADEVTLQRWRRNTASPHKLEWALEPLHPKRQKPRYRQPSIRRFSGHGYCRGSESSRRFCNDHASGRRLYYR